MKIGFSGMWLHSGKDSKNSGLSRYAFQMLDQFQEIGKAHQWEIYHPALFTPPPAWRRAGFQFHKVPAGSLVKRVLWEGFEAAKIARRSGLDVWFSAAQTIPFRRTAQRAVMIHDIIPLLYPEYHPRKTVLYYSMAIKYAAKRADLIFTNSETTKRDLVARFEANPESIVVTPLGPGNDLGPGGKKPVSVPFDRYLLTLGNLEPRRNLERLYQALKMIRQTPGQEALGLVVVGGKRPGPHDPDGGLRELGLVDAVHFPGYVSDAELPAIFSNAEVFVYPSLYEGFGMPVLEAMIMGVPVVSSNRSAMPEVGGQAAAYFNPENVREMADEVLRVLGDPEKKRVMAQAGQERSRAFNWHNTASKTLAALETLV
jgi:glycosyltransferase involved in cell wall biosynthesis